MNSPVTPETPQSRKYRELENYSPAIRPFETLDPLELSPKDVGRRRE